MTSELVGIVGSKMSLQPFPGEDLVAHWTAPIQLHCLFEVSVLRVQRQDQLLVACEVAKTALEGAISTDAQTTQVCGSVAISAISTISTISTNAQDFLV